MRKLFAKELLKHAKKNKDIWCVTCDLGMGVWDQFRDELPDQFINVGAAEQAGMDIAIGMSLEGKIPFIYSITPFLLYRPFEAIRTYIDHEQIPVKLVGSGRDKDYLHDGYSHNAEDAREVLSLFDIEEFWPTSKGNIPKMVKEMIENEKPSFISLRR